MSENQNEANERKEKIRERYRGADAENMTCIPAIPREDFFTSDTPKRVAVYARVSTDDPNQTSSYELQKNYYEDMVTKKDNWELVDIYADEGISGTSMAHRDNFKRMIADCVDGKIDLIVTKSVSRFARNIVDCIGYVRDLKALNPPVAVFFETERIYTLDDKSEMSLAFIATLAQEESHSKSEVMNTSLEMRFKSGILLTPVLLGYDHDEDGKLVINESEAATVRIIFFAYIFGYSTGQIADALTELGRLTKKGNTCWTSGSVYQVLINERYCGDVLARKTYTPNYLDHKSKKNRHERNQYRWENHHEAIISRKDFFAVQKMIRFARYGNKGYYPELKVVTSGILAGYVTVHPFWAPFTEKDYFKTSEKAIDGLIKIPPNPAKFNVEKGSVDLRGFELVRRAFLSTKGQIEVTFFEGHIVFNSVAVNKFPELHWIELLVMPHKRLMAVRPLYTKTRYSLPWSRNKQVQAIPTSFGGHAYLTTLYNIFGWKQGATYKVAGRVQKNNEESFLLFDMSEAVRIVTIMPKEQDAEVTGEKKRVKKHREYPEEWKDSFGEDYYSTKVSDSMLEEELENSGKTEDMVCNFGEEGVTSAEEAGKQVDRIIREIVDGNV